MIFNDTNLHDFDGLSHHIVGAQFPLAVGVCVAVGDLQLRMHCLQLLQARVYGVAQDHVLKGTTSIIGNHQTVTSNHEAVTSML